MPVSSYHGIPPVEGPLAGFEEERGAVDPSSAVLKDNSQVGLVSLSIPDKRNVSSLESAGFATISPLSLFEDGGGEWYSVLRAQLSPEDLPLPPPWI
jgi:hypothetical protein